MLSTIDKVKDTANVNDAQFRMNLCYDQSNKIDGNLMLKILL